jgi:nucleotide-binding universal stress UspA family protein
MPNYQHILFPIDFSPQIDAAIPYVAAISRHLNAKVTLLSVVPAIWAGRGAKPEYASELENATKERLDRALTAEVHGLAVERVVRSGEPAEEIIGFTQEHGVDLIMMPTHGYGRFRGLLLGSVTAKVLHDAHCPLWTAAHAAEQSARHIPQTIICCVDGTQASVDLIRQAAQFSGRFDAALQLLYVVAPVSDWEGFADDRQVQEEERTIAHQLLDKLCTEAGVAAPFHIAVGSIASTVAERAGEEAADLLIIGRGKIGATLGRLRTHAQGIIQRSPCPVLSL